MVIKKTESGDICEIKEKNSILQKVGDICFCRSGPLVVYIVGDMRSVSVLKTKTKTLKSYVKKVNLMLAEVGVNGHTI